MERQGYRAAELIRQMLTFSRQQHMEMQTLAPASLLKETMKLHRVVMPENIRFEGCWDADDAMIRGDATLLQQILLNLLANARDAVSEVEHPHIRLHFGMAGPDDEIYHLYPKYRDMPLLCLSVADNGCGIEKSILNKIFDPFFTTKNVGEGTGLGLAMVYGAMQSHGGEILVTSEPGKGSEFRLYFPRLDAGASASVSEEEGGICAVTGNGLGILVADDESALREVLRETFHDLDYRVFVAEDGRQALEVFRRHADEIDLAVLDVVMPNMGGVDACLAMREIKPGLPVLFHTGYGQDVLAEALEELPCCASISKPATIEKLTGKIARLLQAAEG